MPASENCSSPRATCCAVRGKLHARSEFLLLYYPYENKGLLIFYKSLKTSLPHALPSRFIVEITLWTRVIKRCFSSQGTVMTQWTSQDTNGWVWWTIVPCTTFRAVRLACAIIVRPGLTAQRIRRSCGAIMSNRAWTTRHSYCWWIRNLRPLKTIESWVARSGNISESQIPTIIPFCAVLTLILIF